MSMEAFYLEEFKKLNDRTERNIERINAAQKDSMKAIIEDDIQRREKHATLHEDRMTKINQELEKKSDECVKEADKRREDHERKLGNLMRSHRDELTSMIESEKEARKKALKKGAVVGTIGVVAVISPPTAKAMVSGSNVSKIVQPILARLTDH